MKSAVAFGRELCLIHSVFHPAGIPTVGPWWSVKRAAFKAIAKGWCKE